MPAWALRIVASLVLSMTLVGSVGYVSAHPKNPLAPLAPKVDDDAAAELEAMLGDAIADPVPVITVPAVTAPPRRSPSPRPSASPTAAATRASASPGRPGANAPVPTPVPTAAPTVRPTPTPLPQITLAPSVRTSTLKPVTRTRLS